MNREWWLGHLAGGNQSGFVPDGYIKLKSRRRDSAPIHQLPPLSVLPNSSSSINIPISTNDQLDIGSSLSFVDEQRLESAEETEILECSKHPIPLYRTIYDILPPNPPSPISTNDHNLSTSSSSSHLTSTNDQQIIDIDTALREVLSGIQTVEEYHAECFRTIQSNNSQQEADAPDLVLNLPISTGLITPPSSIILDEKPSSSILHSTIILDVNPIHFRQKQQTISISGSSKATEV